MDPIMELPSIEITSHSNNDPISGLINLSGTASDPLFEITSIQISIDGGDWIFASGTDRWYYIWNTNNLANREHEIRIRGYNGRYYSENASITLYVDSSKEDSSNRAPIIIAITVVVFGCVGIIFYREDIRFLLLSLYTVPLYSKIEKSDILDQSTRNDIYSFISKKPGSNYSTIKKRLDLGTSSLVYHLNVLQKEGFIRSKKEMGRKLFFPKAGGLPFGTFTVSAPTSPIHQRILNHLKETGPKSRKDLEDSLSLKRQTVSYCMKSLEKRGLVRARGKGRNDPVEIIHEKQ